jgi:GT2 family glycosyltransferase
MAARPGLAPTLVGADPGLGPDGQGVRIPRIGRAGVVERIEAIWALAGVAKLRAPLPRPARPVVSFVAPVFDAPPDFLDALLASFRDQGAGAELILSDDGSASPTTLAWLDAHAAAPGVRVLRAARNRGIAAATNAGLAAARGDWVGLVDHDDALAPHALDQLRRALADAPQAVFIYTDEAIADAALRPVGAFFKPAFDPVLLSGMNYVNHLSLYRRDRLLALGGLREGFHGSQDYELVLRYCRGLEAGQIVHLPYPAYVWRQRPDSVSHAQLEAATDAARRALAEHMGAVAPGAAAVPATLLPNLHRVRLSRARPAISAVIPNRDSPELLGRLLEDLETRTDRPPEETVIVDNGTTDPRTLALYAARRDRADFRLDLRPEPFNFARMVNRGVTLARGEAILLLNNDLSALEPGWLDEMVECLAYPGVGVVGARLLYPDRSIQHAGVILGLGGLAGHWHYKARETETGPMGRLAVRNGMTVVTGACMLVTRACWEAVGGMDETRFAVAYNDVDFCARARGLGFGVVWTPFATLLHHESASRGSDLLGEKRERFRREKAALAALHGTASFVDPCFSPWWSRWQSRPRPAARGELASPRHFHGMAAWPAWSAPAEDDRADDQAMR